MARRGFLLSAVFVLLVALVALPVLAAEPSPSGEASPSAESSPSEEASPSPSPEEPSPSPSPEEPSPSPAPESPSAEPSPAVTQPSPAEETDDPGNDQGPTGKPDKADKVKTPDEPISISGTVTTATDADGDVVYSLATGGTSYELEAGPSWFFGTNHPLKPYVGESVRIDGEKKVGSNQVDVLKVNGTVIREPGKPPWAGGWKAVGQTHPGWSQEKWDRWQAKKAAKAARFGGCWPPGHCKAASGTQAAPTPNPDGSPD
jgi:hypothetical protein